MALVRVKVGVRSNVKKRLARVVVDADHLNGGFVATGWMRDEKYPDGTSVARVALWNEFGTHNSNGSVRNPARPFMRPAYRNNRGALMALQMTVIRDVLTQKITPERALNILGYRMWQWVRSAILSNTPPPLAARTLAAKRRAGRPAVTLIDTRRMLDTLGYRIYIGGRGRPPMKDDPSPGGTGGSGGGGSTGGGPTIKPQHGPGGGHSPHPPKANEHPSPGAVGKIPRVMTPGEIRREKKSLQDELRKARKNNRGGKNNPSPAGPGGGGKRVRVQVGGGKKKPRIGPKGPSAPKKPPPTKGTAKSPRPARSRPRKANAKVSPKVVRPAREQEREKRREGREQVRKERHTRSKTAHGRRSKGILNHLEEALLRNIIAMARAASRYGRRL